MKNYQLNYASSRPQMYDKKSRLQKAKRLVKTLNYYYMNNSLNNKILLDIGSSTGIIDNYLASYFKKVVGIDIDSEGINFAKKKFKKKNLSFKTADAMKLPFKSGSFDVVVCTHIYEHVPDPTKLFSEIHRVLKKGGICYLAALNKWWIIEPHYNLPFLSWLPKNIANFYIKIIRHKSGYYETLLSYWQLKALTKKFEVKDYTPNLLRKPKIFGYDDSIPEGSILHLIVKLISPFSKYLSPTFFWIIKK